jgi:hypothetical protein
MSKEHMDQGFVVVRKVVAIPASNAASANIKTWATLASLTADQSARCIGVYCSKYLPNSATQRGAIQVSDSATVLTASEYIAAGEEYYRPVTQDCNNSYPVDPANAGINALAIFILTASAGSV